MTPSRRTKLALFLMGVSALFGAGCSGSDQVKTVPVHGKVSYKGKPVPKGTVMFMPDSCGPPATGEIQPDGSFTLTTYAGNDGAVLGKHKVVIVAIDRYLGELPEAQTKAPPAPIPNKYTSPATSTLSADVQEKDNTIDFDLQ